MLLCHFKFSFKKDKLNIRFIGTLTVYGMKTGHSCFQIVPGLMFAFRNCILYYLIFAFRLGSGVKASSCHSCKNSSERNHQSQGMFYKTHWSLYIENQHYSIFLTHCRCGVCIWLNRKQCLFMIRWKMLQNYSWRSYKKPASYPGSLLGPRVLAGGKTLAVAGHVTPCTNFTPWGVGCASIISSIGRHVGLYCFPFVLAFCCF